MGAQVCQAGLHTNGDRSVLVLSVITINKHISIVQPVWLAATMGGKKYQRSVRKVQWGLGHCLPQFVGMHNAPHNARESQRLLSEPVCVYTGLAKSAGGVSGHRKQHTAMSPLQR